MEKGCPKCGRMINAAYESCPHCGYNLSEITAVYEKFEKQKYLEDEKYAGFVRRLIAGLVDLFFTSILSFVLAATTIDKIGNLELKQSIIIILATFALIYLIYNILFELIPWHATIGKHLVGIEVVGKYEDTITLKESFVRNITKILNIITLGIGFLMSSFPPSKQALNDKIAHTYVINEITMKDEENLTYANPVIRLLAYIVDSIVISLMIFAITQISFLIIGKLTIPSMTTTNLTISTTTIISAVVTLFYFPICESRNGSTFGKSLFKLKVTDIDGEIISFLKSFVRQFLIIVDILFFGWLYCFVSKRKQTIKDLSTKTIVIKR